jgi:hypothetical protein
VLREGGDSALCGVSKKIQFIFHQRFVPPLPRI